MDENQENLLQFSAVCAQLLETAKGWQADIRKGVPPSDQALRMMVNNIAGGLTKAVRQANALSGTPVDILIPPPLATDGGAGPAVVAAPVAPAAPTGAVTITVPDPKLQAELEDARAGLTGLQTKCNVLQMARDKAQADLDKALSELAEVKSALDVTKSQLAKVQAELETAKAAARNASEAVPTAAVTPPEAGMTTEEMVPVSVYYESIADNDRMAAKLAEAQKEVDRLTAELNALRNDNVTANELRVTLSAKSAEVEDLRKEITQLNKKLEENKIRINALLTGGGETPRVIADTGSTDNNPPPEPGSTENKWSDEYVAQVYQKAKKGGGQPIYILKDNFGKVDTLALKDTSWRVVGGGNEDTFWAVEHGSEHYILPRIGNKKLTGLAHWYEVHGDHVDFSDFKLAKLPTADKSGINYTVKSKGVIYFE